MKLFILMFTLVFVQLATYSQQAGGSKKVMNVAIFIHEEVELLDFSGPGEVFSAAMLNGEHLFNVYTVAATTNEITSQHFVKIKPTYSIYNCPPPDIVILPGGATNIPAKDEKVINWIKNAGTHSEYLLSVCTGVFLLAKAGLLDGKTATTHYCCQDDLAKEYPKLKLVKGKRFVDNGKIITTEGISAGIDGSLYLISKIYGQPVSQEIAKYMMYNWTPDKLDVMVLKQ